MGNITVALIVTAITSAAWGIILWEIANKLISMM